MPTQKYTVEDGTVVPGTTTIISTSLGWGRQRLMGWAWKRGRDGKNMRDEEALDAGTLAHALAEANVKGKDVPDASAYSEEAVKAAQTAYKAFLRWKRMSKLTLLFSEIPLVSEQVRYGGTIDAIGTVGGEMALIDFKTSKHTYPDHVIQLAAYRKLWEENHPEQVLRGGAHILRFGKGEFPTFAHYQIPWEAIVGAPWTAFLALRCLYDLREPIERLV